MKKQWRNIKEFFWPMLEGPKPKDPIPIQLSQIVIDDEHLDDAIKWQEKIYDSEEERRKGTESKAALFLSTISIASSLVLAATTLVNSNKQATWQFKLMIFFSFIVCLYAARTVWFAVKTLQRGNYNVLSFRDINITDKDKKWSKTLIKNLANNTLNNQNTINEKVDNLAMAQDYYLRALGWLCAYAFMLLILTFFTSPIAKTDSLQAEFNIKSLRTLENSYADAQICEIGHGPSAQLKIATAPDSSNNTTVDGRTVRLKLGKITAPNYPDAGKVADSAMHIASVLLSAAEFKVLIDKMDFTCMNYSRYCSENCKNCSDRFGGTVVLDSIFREKEVTLDLFLRNCNNEFGHSWKNVKEIYSCKPIVFYDEKKLSPAYCYAYHVAHEYMHIIGFFHTDYKDDVAHQVGWIGWEILTKWRAEDINVMNLQPGQQ